MNTAESFNIEEVRVFARPLGNNKFGFRAEIRSPGHAWLSHMIEEARKDAQAKDERPGWPMLRFRPCPEPHENPNEAVLRPLRKIDSIEPTDLALGNVTISEAVADDTSVFLLVEFESNAIGNEEPQTAKPSLVSTSITKELMKAIERGEIRMKCARTKDGVKVMFDDGDRTVEEELSVAHENGASGAAAHARVVGSVDDATIDKLIGLFERRSRVTRAEVRQILEGTRG